jgi:hypothetical protein
MITSAAELFKAAGLKTKTVNVLGSEITIRELSVGARLRLADADKKSAAQVLISESLVTPDGKPLLTPEDAAKLTELSADFVDAVAAEILKFSRPDEKKG